MDCRSCKGTFVAWDLRILDQLPEGIRARFPVVLTYKYACDRAVIAALRARTLGNSPTAPRNGPQRGVPAQGDAVPAGLRPLQGRSRRVRQQQGGRGVPAAATARAVPLCQVVPGDLRERLQRPPPSVGSSRSIRPRRYAGSCWAPAPSWRHGQRTSATSEARSSSRCSPSPRAPTDWSRSRGASSIATVGRDSRVPSCCTPTETAATRHLALHAPHRRRRGQRIAPTLRHVYAATQRVGAPTTTGCCSRRRGPCSRMPASHRRPSRPSGRRSPAMSWPCTAAGGRAAPRRP